VDVSWHEGKLKAATLRSDRDQSVHIRYGDNRISVPLVAGAPTTVSANRFTA
jgi:hypothetical protein